MGTHIVCHPREALKLIHMIKKCIDQVTMQLLLTLKTWDVSRSWIKAMVFKELTNQPLLSVI